MLIPVHNICCAGLIWASVGFLLCGTGFGAPPAQGGGGVNNRKEWQPLIDANVKKWQEMFGPINFHDELLYDCMVYLHPQAKVFLSGF
jgi:hypothetical protein